MGEFDLVWSVYNRMEFCNGEVLLFSTNAPILFQSVTGLNVAVWSVVVAQNWPAQILLIWLQRHLLYVSMIGLLDCEVF